jgi:hypothetical protein
MPAADREAQKNGTPTRGQRQNRAGANCRRRLYPPWGASNGMRQMKTCQNIKHQVRHLSIEPISVLSTHYLEAQLRIKGLKFTSTLPKSFSPLLTTVAVAHVPRGTTIIAS